jgi:hypothetical protein
MVRCSQGSIGRETRVKKPPHAWVMLLERLQPRTLEHALTQSAYIPPKLWLSFSKNCQSVAMTPSVDRKRASRTASAWDPSNERKNR